jgi:hypothetical protein
MNLEVLLERAAKTPDKQLLYNDDYRLGESMACSFNEIKELIEDSENLEFSNKELIEIICTDNFDLTENITNED